MHSMSNRLPDFIIMGSAKAGTTSLYSCLMQHSGIYMSDPKEPCFFDEGANWEKGLAWYSSLFQDAKKHDLCGEASTNYTRWPQVKNVPKKIQEVLPDVKLIYIVRNPMERSYSHYLHRWAKELHPGEAFHKNFSEHIETDPMCIDSSNYFLQLEKYLEVFEKDQILVITFEELVGDPSKTIEKTLEFIGLINFDSENMKFPHSNSNSQFRYHVVRNEIIKRSEKIPGFRSFRKIIPTCLKNHLYDHLFLKMKNARLLTASLAPAELTESEKLMLKEKFEESNRHLAEKWGIDISSWQ